jgi:hypothetical protein
MASAQRAAAILDDAPEHADLAGDALEQILSRLLRPAA